MDTDLKFEFEIDLKPVSHKSYRYYMAKIVNEPRLRQYLVLAYQIQETLDPSTSFRVNPEQGRGIAHDSAITAKQIAGWLNMTPPRISQILNLLFLSPVIQKEILLSNDEKIRALTEHKILAITKEIDWEKQQATWKNLLK